MSRQQKRGAASQVRHSPNATCAVKLGDAVGDLLARQILPHAAKANSVVEVWMRLLPPSLAAHCRLAQVAAGRVKVIVDSAPYMYELQLCRSDLLRELRRQCPHARIRELDFAIG